VAKESSGGACEASELWRMCRTVHFRGRSAVSPGPSSAAGRFPRSSVAGDRRCLPSPRGECPRGWCRTGCRGCHWPARGRKIPPLLPRCAGEHPGVGDRAERQAVTGVAEVVLDGARDRLRGHRVAESTEDFVLFFGGEPVVKHQHVGSPLMHSPDAVGLDPEYPRGPGRHRQESNGKRGPLASTQRERALGGRPRCADVPFGRQ